MICPACAAGSPEGAKFCAECGAALAAPRAHPEERKVVTTLVCDLVGFTALSEAADPEDVDGLLSEYAARARRVVESHGGTVEKFIGDAVVAVFGVPVVHEDDPERAVRAGLRLVEGLEGLERPDGTPLQVRIGVNTGEALVRLEVDPASGRGFLTGDAVNVAARLQGLAPPMGVVVGATTYALTASTIDYQMLEPVIVKGKGRPVANWLAMGERGRGSADRLGLQTTPFVDRETELAFLSSLFGKAVTNATPHFALVVGEPGIGKSRLVGELASRIDATGTRPQWLQGRCLPYGEGVTFWALGEIVKAHAGILETDDREATEHKLDAVLPRGADREWFRQRLRALLGLDASHADRDENFMAWLRFLEDVAAVGPTVVLFEDLHWADVALLAFLERMSSDVSPVPLMVLGTARPELLERYPALAAAARINRIVLEPLTDADTTLLVTSLLREAAADVRSAIVKRSQGNPFYAEESSRLAMERARLDDIPVAESVQAVIAARLDALPAAAKATLADAAVVGEVFWSGAVAALSALSEDDVDNALRDLLTKQLVHRVRTSSMQGEREYSFGHALARDVAYQQLPRAVRAQKHAAAARWVEAKAGERVQDVAEVLAHHYATALDLARATNNSNLASSLLAPALRSLTLAGDHASALDISTAERYFARALDLAPSGSPARPRLLVSRGQALHQRGRYRDAVATFGEGIEGLWACGETQAAAVAMMWMAGSLSEMCDPLASDLIVRAATLIAEDPPSPDGGLSLEVQGVVLWLEGDPQRGVGLLDRAVATYEQLGESEPIDALGHRGAARCAAGDTGGLEDYRRALNGCRVRGLGREMVVLTANYADDLLWVEGPDRTLEMIRESHDVALRRGLEGHARKLRVHAAECLALNGRWDEALAEAEELQPLLEEENALWDLTCLWAMQSDILARRGRQAEAVQTVERLLESGQGSRIVFVATRSVLAAAGVRRRLGHTAAARELLQAWADRPSAGGTSSRAGIRLPEAVRAALAIGDPLLAERLAGGIHTQVPLDRNARASLDALLAEARGEHEAAAAGFTAAASCWHEFGVPYEEAQALLGQGRCLLALDRAPDAAAVLMAARDIFVNLGAEPAVHEVDDLQRRPRDG